jgi:hypothetical protein
MRTAVRRRETPQRLVEAVFMDPRAQAQSFLSGEALTFAEADALWQELAKSDVSLARRVASRLRDGKRLIERAPLDRDAYVSSWR